MSNSKKTNQEIIENFKVCIELMFSPGKWFQVPYALHSIKPKGHKLKDAAYTLASMLHQSSMQSAVQLNEGWFDFCGERARKDTGFSPDRQLDHMRLLECTGLIERRRVKEIHGKRETRIDYSRLAKLFGMLSKNEEEPTEPLLLREKPVSKENPTKKVLREKPVSSLLREKPASGCGENPQDINRKKDLKEETPSPVSARGVILVQTPDDEFYKEAVAQYHKILYRKKLREKEPNPKTYTKYTDLRTLVNDIVKRDGTPLEEVKQTIKSDLIAYANAADLPFAPSCLFLNVFCLRYSSHVVKFLRGLRAKENDSAPVSLTPEEDAIVKQLRMLGWPNGAEEQLPRVVPESIANYKKFKERLQALEGNSSAHRLANTMRQSLQPAKSFVLGWFEQQHERFADWEDWSGNLVVFTPRAKEFLKQGRHISNEFCGRSKTFDDLLDLLEKK